MGWSFLYAIKTMPCTPHRRNLSAHIGLFTVLLLRRRTYECLRHAAARWSVNDVSPKGKLLTAHVKHLLIFELMSPLLGICPILGRCTAARIQNWILRAIPFCSMQVVRYIRITSWAACKGLGILPTPLGY